MSIAQLVQSSLDRLDAFVKSERSDVRRRYRIGDDEPVRLREDEYRDAARRAVAAALAEAGIGEDRATDAGALRRLLETDPDLWDAHVMSRPGTTPRETLRSAVANAAFKPTMAAARERHRAEAATVTHEDVLGECMEAVAWLEELAANRQEVDPAPLRAAVGAAYADGEANGALLAAAAADDLRTHECGRQARELALVVEHARAKYGSDLRGEPGPGRPSP